MTNVRNLRIRDFSLLVWCQSVNPRMYTAGVEVIFEIIGNRPAPHGSAGRLRSFNNIPHDLMMKAVRQHARQAWVILYIERWLCASAQDEEGTLRPRTKGTPQGGVMTPPAHRSDWLT